MNKEKNKKSELSPSEINHGSGTPDEMRRFSNYTQDTLKEVLSWYGLQEPSVVTSMAGHGDADSVTVTLLSASSPQGSPPVRCRGEVKSADFPLDLTHCQLKTECDPVGLTDGSMLDVGGQHSQSHKKVGMRFIFPPLSDELSLLEKAQIWVARHNYKYFVNWTEEQLKSVDRILQPVVPVTPSLYKTHMNRSEYCRNVKLKFCLEADAPWSREFRERLQKPANEGGFSGLCQAKIAAAELWRRYSENYKSHQARYPNPKNRYRKRTDLQVSNPEHATNFKMHEEAEGKCDIPYKRRRRSSEYEQGRPGRNGVDGDVDDTEDVDIEDAMCSQEACCKEEYRALIESGSGMCMPVDACTDRVVEAASASNKHSPRPSAIQSPSPQFNGKGSTSQKAPSISPCGSEADFHGRGLSTPLSPEMSSKMTSCINYDTTVSPPESAVLASSTHNGIAISDMFLNGTQKQQQLLQQQQPEYKRSERGLSYLFPSLNDHKLSLLDKVWITVVRHKNNYFLGWQEDSLATVDPLIRPKMVITTELYREYCHRNAMKYDSNLQFCMESPEPWACEFREKLRRAPCQGGFGSLCEVKLEAGRLWREYSGKYRMHNIVKWHMDMNNMTTTSTSGSVAAADSSPTDVEQSKADVLMSPVLQHQRAESSKLQLKSESPAQSGSASPVDPAPLPGLSAGLRVEVDLTKKPNAIDDERAVQLLRRSSSVDAGAVKATSTPTIVHPPASSKPDTRHTPPSRAADTFDDGSPLQLDSLFRPLPKNLSVFEQMCIWLERHHRNYFVGYSPSELAQLDEHVRPQMFVTKEVFEKHVSESMMDVLNKVETIMRCDEPWARVYQEKLRGFDGGFVSFEEALTQAVILWATRQPPSSLQTGAKVYSKQEGVRNVTMTETSPGNGRSSQHTVTRLSPSQLAGVIRTRPQYQSSNSDDAAPVATTVDSVSSENHTKNYAIPENNAKASCESETATSVMNCRMTPEEAGSSHAKSVVADTQVRSLSSPIDAMWRYRDVLRAVCADDPYRSWEERLQPCLPTLRQTLGADYRCPERMSDCMVDLLLATIQQRFVDSDIGGQQSDS